MDGGTSLHLSMPSEPTPRTYLTFAQGDLSEADSKRNRVNALSNAKRALHFQVDLLSEALGIEHAKLGKRLSFPQKLEFCANCGVVSPRILNKLNRLRNTVEHDYYLPTKDQAEDFVDVVELFLEGTNQFVRSFPDMSELTSPEEKKFHGISRKYLHIDFPPSKGIITVSTQEFSGKAAILHDEAQRIREEQEKKKRARKNSNIREVIIGGSPENIAYRAAFYANCEKKKFNIKAEDGAIYHRWVSFILSKVRS